MHDIISRIFIMSAFASSFTKGLQSVRSRVPRSPGVAAAAVAAAGAATAAVGLQPLRASSMSSTPSSTTDTVEVTTALSSSSSSSAAAAAAAAPTSLGKMPGGPAVANKATIFQEIDDALGVSKPPDIEVILTDHLTNTANPLSKFLHINLMRFWHLTIRYRTSDGEQYIMNIRGDFNDPEAEMVNFVKPNDYFFGTNPVISQQGGLYSRPFVGVRIENVATGATDALHQHFVALQEASKIGTNENNKGVAPGSSDLGAVRFQLVEVNFSKIARSLPSPFDNWLISVTDFIRKQDDKRKGAMTNMAKKVEAGVEDVRQAAYSSGNCAQWSSGGMAFVGLIRRPRLFPKAVLIELLEDEYLKAGRKDNVHVVYYSEIEHAVKRDPSYRCVQPAMVHPLKPIRNRFYENMRDFASVVVETPPGSNVAKAIAQTPTRVPEQWILNLSMASTYLPAAIMVGVVKQVGPIGPAAAAGWLFANWWLY